MRRDLYWFQEGATAYRLTSADKPYTHLGNVYTPTTLKRTEIESTKEINKSSMDVSFPITHPTARHWLIDRPEVSITLTVFEIDEDGDVNVGFKGRYTTAKPTGAEIVCVFETIFTSLRRNALRARFTRQCRHSLYGRGCGLNMEGFAKPLTATAMSGNVVTVTGAGAFPDDYFTTGIFKAPDGTMRFIVNHVGTSVTLIRPIKSLAAALVGGSQAVKLYPGCDRTRETCLTRFNNIANNGGFEWIPLSNPFGGESIV